MNKPIKLISWNVNGLRAIAKKNFFPFVEEFSPDILALQETKMDESQLTQEMSLDGYERFFASSSLKKGYSGVAIYSRLKPIAVSLLNEKSFDAEGRALIAEYDSFFLINAYFPNSQEAGRRLDYKLSFLDHILTKTKELKARGKYVIVCGDFNIAHQPIDLTHPESNEMSPGYLKEEREWMSLYLSQGMVDTFRFLHPQTTNAYSWWNYRTRGRARNVGWRIDYFCVNQEATSCILEANLLNQILGSDHCPVELIWQNP